MIFKIRFDRLDRCPKTSGLTNFNHVFMMCVSFSDVRHCQDNKRLIVELQQEEIDKF